MGFFLWEIKEYIKIYFVNDGCDKDDLVIFMLMESLIDNMFFLCCVLLYCFYMCFFM